MGDGAAESGCEKAIVDFKTVRLCERRMIDKRRAKRQEKNAASGQADRGGEPSEDLFGVALSGGGIRSASFCLGALQALHAYGLIQRTDYLSTVSGGGYIGASMIAAMVRSPGDFPFASTTNAKDYSDTPNVEHLRDNSAYIAPNGLWDWLKSGAVVMRGLLVNLLFVLALVVPLATVTIAANPTVDRLPASIFLEGFSLFVHGTVPRTGDAQARFTLTLLLLGISAAVLLVRAIRLSFPGNGSVSSVVYSEIASPWTKTATWLLIATVAVLVVEAQSFPIEWLAATLRASLEGGGGASKPATFYGILLTFAAATATFRATLANWIEKALNGSTIGAALRALVGRSLLVLAALVLPILVYVLYLTLVLWGIADKTPLLRPFPAASDVSQHPYPVPFPLMPRILADNLDKAWWIAMAAALAASILALIKKPSNGAKALLVAFIFVAVCVGLSYVAKPGPAEKTLSQVYLLTSCALIALTPVFDSNANSLHRLYRERLNAAFQLHIHAQGRDAGPLTFSAVRDAVERGDIPYPLVNAALNIRKTEESGGPQGRKFGTDPARRGRKADFFLFSPCYVGSEITGFVDTRTYCLAEPDLDLATAVAVSGAAVSSSMGRIQIGLLRPTLALLNLRLGRWFKNPARISRKNGQAVFDRRSTRVHDRFGLYPVLEALGLMDAASPHVYVTDGGHIDNLGLYQLLRRKCALIVVVDAEADPSMTFAALADVERFARIDLGCKIDIDCRPLHDAALARSKDRARIVPSDLEPHRQHAAIGTIDYCGGERGLLLYVKASVTGDEPSYVLDYERRYPTFPHESTGDQLFSEEQMESYRALGFHAVGRALSQRACWQEGVPRRRIAPDPLLADMKRRLGITGAEI